MGHNFRDILSRVLKSCTNLKRMGEHKVKEVEDSKKTEAKSSDHKFMLLTSESTSIKKLFRSKKEGSTCSDIKSLRLELKFDELTIEIRNHL